MSTPIEKSEYLFLFRGTEWNKDLSPEQTQKAVGEFMAWFQRLSDKGIVKGGQPLTNEGKVVSGKKATVADGPFAEAKEAVGGYFLLQAASLDEATELAKGCPTLQYGAIVEVREVAAECAMVKHAAQQLAQATA
jgi:hypothetical protein